MRKRNLPENGCTGLKVLAGVICLFSLNAVADAFTPMVVADEPTVVNTFPVAERLVSNPCEIVYDHAWGQAVGDDARLALQSAVLTSGAEVEFAPAAELAGACGIFAYQADLAEGAARRMRLVALDEAGAVTEVLAEADLVFPLGQGESGEACVVDTCPDSLQLMVDERQLTDLAYDTQWFGNFSQGRLVLTLTREPVKSDTTPASTRTLVSEANPATGVCTVRLPALLGQYTLALVPVDAGGQPLAEPLTSGYAQLKTGLAIVIR